MHSLQPMALTNLDSERLEKALNIASENLRSLTPEPIFDHKPKCTAFQYRCRVERNRLGEKVVEDLRATIDTRSYWMEEVKRLQDEDLNNLIQKHCKRDDASAKGMQKVVQTFQRRLQKSGYKRQRLSALRDTIDHNHYWEVEYNKLKPAADRHKAQWCRDFRAENQPTVNALQTISSRKRPYTETTQDNPPRSQRVRATASLPRTRSKSIAENAAKRSRKKRAPLIARH